MKTWSGTNAYDDDRYTHLHKAVKAGDVKTTALLLDSGADPNAISKAKERMAPIHMAVDHRNEIILQLLLARKAVNANATDNDKKNGTRTDMHE